MNTDINSSTASSVAPGTFLGHAYVASAHTGTAFTTVVGMPARSRANLWAANFAAQSTVAAAAGSTTVTPARRTGIGIRLRSTPL